MRPPAFNHMLNLMIVHRFDIMLELEAIHGKTAPTVEREAAEIKHALIGAFGDEDGCAIWHHMLGVREANILLARSRLELFAADSDEIHEPPIVDWNHNER